MLKLEAKKGKQIVPVVLGPILNQIRVYYKNPASYAYSYRVNKQKVYLPRRLKARMAHFTILNFYVASVEVSLSKIFSWMTACLKKAYFRTLTGCAN